MNLFILKLHPGASIPAKPQGDLILSFLSRQFSIGHHRCKYGFVIYSFYQKGLMISLVPHTIWEL